MLIQPLRGTRRVQMVRRDVQMKWGRAPDHARSATNSDSASVSWIELSCTARSRDSWTCAKMPPSWSYPAQSWGTWNGPNAGRALSSSCPVAWFRWPPFRVIPESPTVAPSRTRPSCAGAPSCWVRPQLWVPYPDVVVPVLLPWGLRSCCCCPLSSVLSWPLSWSSEVRVCYCAWVWFIVPILYYIKLDIY